MVPRSPVSLFEIHDRPQINMWLFLLRRSDIWRFLRVLYHGFGLLYTFIFLRPLTLVDSHVELLHETVKNSCVKLRNLL